MFTKDNRAENFLTQMGVDFRYKNGISMDDLVQDWDTNNIARPVPVRDEAVLEYASLMEGGSPAPAPIVQKIGDAYVPLDGVQRLCAARFISQTMFSAYVVTCDSEDIIAVIRVLANARLQGRAEPAEWTRKRAVEILVIQRGLSHKEVALMGGWKVADIQRIDSCIRWSNCIEAHDGPQLPDTMLEEIASHATMEDINRSPTQIVEFLKTLKTARFSRDDAVPHLDEFFRPISKASKRDAIYQKRLEDFRENPEVQTRLHGRRSRGMAKDILLIRCLKSSITVLDEMIRDGKKVHNVDELFRLNNEARKKIELVSPKKRGKR